MTKRTQRKERIAAVAAQIKATPMPKRKRLGYGKRIGTRVGNCYAELLRHGRTPEQANSILSNSVRVWK